jgi:hypothetical protein
MTKKFSPTNNLCPGLPLIMGNDARMLHLREGTSSIGYVLVLVPGTFPYLNLCPYTYISFSKNIVPHTGTHIGYWYRTRTASKQHRL